MAQQSRIGKTATTVSRGPDGEVAVTYHATRVVIVDTSNRVFLNSGGYRTPTTKTRMNQASNEFNLGFQVFQDEGQWFVRLPGGKNVEFSDGMSFKGAS